MTKPDVLPGEPTSIAPIETREPSPELPLLFLRSLSLSNFRSIDNANFSFQPGLNVIIGANNAAKSTVIDALRLILGQCSYEKREDQIRLRHTDVFRSDASQSTLATVKFQATFSGRSESDLPAQFYEMCCPDDVTIMGEPGVGYTTFKLLYQADFEINSTTGRFEHVRSDLRGGPDWNNPVPRSVLDGIRAIYLAPLRDLINDRARVGAEIERLVVSHTPDGRSEELRSIPAQLRTRAEEMLRDVTGNAHHAAAGRNLAAYAKPYGIAETSVSFAPQGVSDDLLRTMLPVFAHALHGSDGLPLSSNGLGMNQLIYASIVLSRRGPARATRDAHRFFLIEEPEAHLHPQMQDSFFHALNKITEHQIFVTSHSPTITAKTDVDKIIVMRRNSNGTAHPLHLESAFVGQKQHKRYLHKFLDVTRSQLLFASGALFVEGVTEALLMQRFSEIMGASLRDHAIEVVVIDSDEGFDHFRPLFGEDHGPYSRAVFVTDSDVSPLDVKSDEEFLTDIDSALDPGLLINNATATATGYGTFEFGLLRTAIAGSGNLQMLEILKNAFAAAAPDAVSNTGKQDLFVRDFLDNEHPALAYKKMKEKRKGTCLTESDWYSDWHTNSHFKRAKSEFAFHLNEALSAMSDDQAAKRFIVPRYIQDAIRFVTHTDEKAEEIDAPI
ncbi:ATP-dependent nuclease [Micromonospora taraxaci]|uniref:ATP-dependent nuclease n=1 Tax=Micromonospora taraxaci TaxID=1316803 RepID=UPI0033AE9E70